MDNPERIPIDLAVPMTADQVNYVATFLNSETLDVAKELARFVQVQSRLHGTHRSLYIYWLLQDAKRVGLL